MKRIKTPDYPFTIRHLTLEEGGGYLIEYPDLPGCMSDGETIEEAIYHGQDAIRCWIEGAKEAGRDIPKPNELEKQSGKWVQRVPKSIHLRNSACESRGCEFKYVGGFNTRRRAG